jgi:chemotaxis signal transduction protein
MAIVSPLRARRNANRPVESTQQVIMFCLRQHWFALPMETVKRVSSLDFSVSNSHEPISTTGSTDDAELTTISANQAIFLDAGPELDAEIGSQEPDEPFARFLIVVQRSNGETYGLTIRTAPKMQRISPASIAPFSPTDSALKSMHCISGVVNQAVDSQTLYLLNPELLSHNT